MSYSKKVMKRTALFLSREAPHLVIYPEDPEGWRACLPWDKNLDRELAFECARQPPSSPTALLRVQMSEFMEQLIKNKIVNIIISIAKNQSV